MTDIKVNKKIWDAVSEVDKQNISAHLREYGVLKPGHHIIADANTLLPSITCHINEVPSDDECIKALGIDWMCRAICDSSKAETHCSLYGQSLPACLATIATSRATNNADCETA
jgi:hypothetical protein